jgi:hypothetical protein
MILFKKDWKKYKGAIVDYKTTNIEALKTAFIYEKMGVKNWQFILALHNPELQGIDPLANDLPRHIRDMIHDEMSENPWYYFREVARVPAKGAIEPVRFRLNRANVALYWCYFNHKTTLLIQARQTGKSLSTNQLYVWIIMFGSENYSIELLTKDNKLRVENIDVLKKIIDLLPSWMNFRSKKDSNNNEYISINAKRNSFNTNVAQMTETGAFKVGRGLTAPTVGVDEICFISNLSITLSALLPSMGAARDSARDSGQPYGTMFYTTAGFLDDPVGEYVYDEIYSKAYPFREELFDCEDVKAVDDVVGKVSKAGIALIEMNHRKLGYTDEWVKDKMATALAKGERAAADYLLIWSRGKVTSALDKNIIKRLENSIRDSESNEITPENLTIEWYISDEKRDEYRNKPFVIGLDTSSAFGDDDIGMHLRCPLSGETLGKGKYNNISLSTFGEFMYNFMMKYKKSILVIERHSSAMGILDHLESLFRASGENIFKRVFNWVVDDYKARENEYRELLYGDGQRNPEVFYIKHRKKFGFVTAGAGKSSRNMLYSEVLMESIKYTGDLTHDRNLVYQMIKLEVKDGRIDHKSGEHDDLVFAYMLTYWFLTRAKNLKYYGINPNLVLSSVVIKDEEMIDERADMQDRAKRKKLIDEMASILDTMEVTGDRVLVYKLNHRLKILKTKLKDSDILSLNIEERISELSKRHKVGL